MGLFSLEKSSLKKNLMAIFKPLRRLHKKDGERLTIKAPNDRKRGNNFKIKSSFRLSIRKTFFTMLIMTQ